MTKEEQKIAALIEDLTSLESYVRELVCFLPLSFCSANSMGIILEANPAFEKLLDSSLDEIIGKSIEEFIGKQKTEEIFKEISQKGEIKDKEMVLLTKKKKDIPISVSVIPRKSEEKNVIGYFISFFDLTKIKEGEKELKGVQSALLNMLEDVEENRKKLEEEKNKTLAIIDNFTDGLLAFNREKKFLLINPQAENLLKIKEEEIKGKSILELARNPNFKSLTELLGKEIKSIFRKEFSTQEGLTLEVSTVLMGAKEKDLTGLIILHDISREKTIERIKTEFVSLAAHQLRTPLSAIKWTLKMLLDGDLGKITEDQKVFVEKTYKSNERMIGLINDLLDITRIEEGRYLYKPALSSFEELVESVINISQDEISKKKIFLDFKKPKVKLPKIKMDVEKVKLVVQNLIDNAVKYTPLGGIIIISLEADKTKREIVFSIKDTGVGIPRDQQQRVFTKFFRGSNVQRMDTEGTGLGLFISKNIIEAHDGRIWFESEEGKGSTFYMVLPVKEKEEFKKFLKDF